MKAAKAMPVNFEMNDTDLEVALLGEAGWHTRAIAQTTDLTNSQVQYRLTLAGVKRADYRNGKSELAQVVLGLVQHRYNERKRIRAVRLLPTTFGNLQQRYIESSSSKRMPQTEVSA